MGTYDGGGYTISNLTIDDNTLSYVGLFGCVGDYWENSGTLLGITLANVSVNSSKPSATVGSLAGSIYGTVENCSVSGEVTGNNATVGGLVGENTGGNIVDSSNESAVRGSMVGGIVGSNEGIIDGCINSGDVSGVGNYASVGGVAGNSSSVSCVSYISNCSNSGDVSGGDGASVGGLVGYNDSADLSGDNSGDVSGGEYASVGGLAGLSYYHAPNAYGQYKSIGTIADSYNSGDVSGGDGATAGGLVGSSYSYVDNATIVTSTNSGSVEGGNSAKVGGLVGEVKGQNIGAKIDGCVNEGSVTGLDETNVGGLVGYNMGGSLANSSNEGRVTGGDCSSHFSGGNIGGLVGELYGGTIEDCENGGAVSGGNGTYVGGLAGNITNGTEITGSTNSGNIRGGDRANLGGLVGYVDYNTAIQESTNSGAVTGGWNALAGGLAGYVDFLTTIDKSSSSGHISGDVGSTVGGLIGTNYGTITNCSATGGISGIDATLGGLIGDDPYSSYSLNSISITAPASKTDYVIGQPLNITGLVVTGSYDGNNTAVLPIVKSHITGFDSGAAEENQTLTITYEEKTDTYTVNIRVFVWPGEGSGTSNDPYLVKMPGLLDAVRYFLDKSDVYFKQTEDIDLSSFSNWLPIGDDYNYSFAGTYDGGGKSISNLKISDDALDAVGLFGYVKEEGTLKNIRLKNANVESTIENGQVSVGGLVGDFASDGVIENCSVEGRVKGASTADIGALAGSCDGTILNSFSSGTVEGADDAYCIGGMVGFLYGTIESSFSAANVRAGDSTAKSSMDTCVGGLIGAGGEIYDCYSTGSVSVGGKTGGTGDMVAGGLAGASADIFASYSTGTVSGGAGAILGGLVAENESYNTVEGSYYLDEAAPASAGGDAKTSAEMRQQATFENWDFTETGKWRIIEDYVCPILKWRAQTADEDIAIDTINLNWSAIKGQNSAENSVTAGLNLRTTGANGTTISWSSGNPAVIASNGTVTRPSQSEEDKDVTLTATVSKEGGTPWTKDFYLTVKAAQPPSGGEAPVQAPVTVDSAGNITARPNLDRDTGVASTAISANTLAVAFERAAENTDGKKTVDITIPAAAGAKTNEVTLPASALTSPAADTQLEITTGMATVTLPGNMLAGGDAQEAQSVSLSIARADVSGIGDEDVKNKIGGRPVIQLRLEIDGKPHAWSNINAPVSVSIPYTPTAAELLNPENIVVWYVDGQGNVFSVPNGRYDAETQSVTFTTTHFSRYAVAYVRKSFADLGGAEWARRPIEIMASKGIINGTGADSFSPNVSITRADYLVLLIKTLGLTAEWNDNFSDVKESSYYYEAVGVAKKLGIATGVENNRFNPLESISRQDMMVLTARALEKFGAPLASGDTAILDKFADSGDIAGYAAGSMAALVREGLIAGSDNRLNPHADTTRAEAAVLLYRIYSK